jgi:hypothetical protein
MQPAPLSESNELLVVDLADVLLRVEWAGIDSICPRCWAKERRGHYDDCQLDALLTRLGFDTDVKRMEYRARLAGAAW